jgi:hypothetical protein
VALKATPHVARVHVADHVGDQFTGRERATRQASVELCEAMHAAHRIVIAEIRSERLAKAEPLARGTVRRTERAR